ncbi:MAG: CPBP family intramembrane glutamic endopeptidase [Acidimicrobiales bacterium]
MTATTSIHGSDLPVVRLGVAAGATGCAAGLAEVLVGSSAWTGNKADPVTLGWVTVALGVAIAGLALALMRSRSAGLLLATGALAPALGLTGLTTAGLAWLPAAVLAIATGAVVIRDLARTGTLAAELSRRWPEALITLLAIVYLALGVASGNARGVLGVAGGLAILGSLAVPLRRPLLAAGLLVAGAVPYGLVAYWTVVAPVTGSLVLLLGLPRASSPLLHRRPVSLRARSLRPSSRSLVFLATFLAAWGALDRLVTSPPGPRSAIGSLAAALAIVGLGQHLLRRGAPEPIHRALGLGPPAYRALVPALTAGLLTLLAYVAGAAATGVTLELRSNWAVVLISALVFHGLAEELVWRGFVFGHLRRTRSFWSAIAWSMPLIALTHVAIIVSNGPLVGGLAVTSAAITCLPFSYLWQRGGGTIWAPAITHGLVGTWQLFERTYPDHYSAVVVSVSILIPLVVFAFGDRFFRPAPRRSTADPTGRPMAVVTAQEVTT